MAGRIQVKHEAIFSKTKTKNVLYKANMRKIIFLLLVTFVMLSIAACGNNNLNQENIDSIIEGVEELDEGFFERGNYGDIPEVIITDGMYDFMIDGTVLTLGKSTHYDMFNIDTLKINNASSRIPPEGALGPAINDYLQDPSWFQEVIHQQSFQYDAHGLCWIPVEADYWIDETPTVLLQTTGTLPTYMDEEATIGSRILNTIRHEELHFSGRVLILNHNIDITFYKGVAVGTHIDTLKEKWGRPDRMADHFEDNILMEYTFRDLTNGTVRATIRVCKETLEVANVMLQLFVER